MGPAQIIIPGLADGVHLLVGLGMANMDYWYTVAILQVMIGLMTFTSLLLAWMGLKINHFDNDGDVIMAICV